MATNLILSRQTSTNHNAKRESIPGLMRGRLRQSDYDITIAGAIPHTFNTSAGTPPEPSKHRSLPPHLVVLKLRPGPRHVQG